MRPVAAGDPTGRRRPHGSRTARRTARASPGSPPTPTRGRPRPTPLTTAAAAAPPGRLGPGLAVAGGRRARADGRPARRHARRRRRVALARERRRGHASRASTATASLPPLEADNGSIAAVAAQLLPSTVQVLAMGGADGEAGGGATGSGFVLDGQGHVITNNHVVAGATDDGRDHRRRPQGRGARRRASSAAARSTTSPCSRSRTPGRCGRPRSARRGDARRARASWRSGRRSASAAPSPPAS